MAPAPISKAKGTLGKKAGPLPIWAWALIAGGGLLALFLYLRRNTEQGGPGHEISLVSGNAGSPEQAAYGGYPQGATPAAQMLDSEVLWTIAGSLNKLSEDQAVASAERHDYSLNLSDQIAGVRDHVSSTVAAATLAAPGLTTRTRAAQAPAKAKQPPPRRYYTYLPGKAPKGRKKDEAPKGKRLGFAKGKGYFVI